MLKGFIVIFTAIISYLFFKRKFSKAQIGGVSIVVVGLILVGLSNIYSYNPKFAPRPILGNTLVILAQFFLGLMFVYEEKILKEYDVNVFEIVGWEGVWGMLISALFITIFYFIPGRDFGSWENPIQATLQLSHNMYLFSAIMISSLVIGPFNYYGTNLTKYSSAMHRCLIDASRMLVVWLICIISKWEQFKVQQAIGYTFVMIGNLIYYEIIKLPTSEKNNTHLPLPKSDDSFSKNKSENEAIINADKEKNITQSSLSHSAIETEVKKSVSGFSKLMNYFYKKKNTNEVIKKKQKDNDNEHNSSNSSDEKEILKDVKNTNNE